MDERLLGFSDCAEVGGGNYALMLYVLAESVKARRILEIGAGWGHSAVAFSESLKSRLPSMLVSIDSCPERVRKQCADLVIESGITWDFIAKDSAEATIDGPFDLVYIDGDPNRAAADLTKFYPLVRPGGLMVLDGYGGQVGPTTASDGAGMAFTPLSYSNEFAFAIFRKPVELNSAGKYTAACKECDDSAIMPSWVSIESWADKHIMSFNHIVAVFAGPRNLRYLKKATH